LARTSAFGGVVSWKRRCAGLVRFGLGRSRRGFGLEHDAPRGASRSNGRHRQSRCAPGSRFGLRPLPRQGIRSRARCVAGCESLDVCDYVHQSYLRRIEKATVESDALGALRKAPSARRCTPKGIVETERKKARSRRLVLHLIAGDFLMVESVRRKGCIPVNHRRLRCAHAHVWLSRLERQQLGAQSQGI
jgi:hypothetical protein